MIELKNLPTSRADIAKIDVDFARLKPDSPRECPRSLAAIRKYVMADGGPLRLDLFFGRTALVGDVRFWLWGYQDGGRTYLVDVSERDGETLLGTGLGDGMTPEQYIALQYVRWWRDRK